MKIESKLAYNYMIKNIKRTIFITLSIMICALILFTTIIVVNSIRKGIVENIINQYGDYYLKINNFDKNSFDKIKNKKYIDMIYIQENGKEQLYKIDELETSINTESIFSVYIKFDNIKNTCKYSTDIIKTLDLTYEETEEMFKFNDKLLTVFGLIDVNVVEKNDLPICQVKLNLSYILDIMILVVFVVFFFLFIIILYNAFLTTINEKKREYAILNSLGAMEWQILKMILLQATIMGIFGIILGGGISILISKVILIMINSLLESTIYKFALVIDIKYIVVSLILIIFNVYISAIIPTLRGNNTSIIQEIKNNKQVKYRKRIAIFDKIYSIEFKLALKNLKRNKNKYRVISSLLVVCMTSYIAVSTYINYEKEAVDILNEHDVDAELVVDATSNIDYISILQDYNAKTGNQIEYMEYKIMGPYVLVEPESALATDEGVATYENNKKSTEVTLVGLDDKTYNHYINKIKGKKGDCIIYNNARALEGEEELVYRYYSVFKTNVDLKLSIIDIETQKFEYEIIDDNNLNGNFILTENLIDGYKEMKNEYSGPTVFLNMDTYNEIDKIFKDYTSQDKEGVSKWMWNEVDAIHIKVKCENIIDFSKYIDNINEQQDFQITADYYSLEKQEKNIYVNILQLILGIIVSMIIIIGITSTISIINACLYERKRELEILESLGSTKENINKILIYECIVIFIKAIIISIIILIPIIKAIIKHMENLIILNKSFIPFKNICLFITFLFILSLSTTLYSTKLIKIGRTENNENFKN